MERNKDSIKSKALEKLDSFVESRIKYYEDNDMSIKEFCLGYIPNNYFTEDEKREIRNSIKQIKDGKVEFYCKCRGIDISDKLK